MNITIVAALLDRVLKLSPPRLDLVDRAIARDDGCHLRADRFGGSELTAQNRVGKRSLIGRLKVVLGIAVMKDRAHAGLAAPCGGILTTGGLGEGIGVVLVVKIRHDGL